MKTFLGMKIFGIGLFTKIAAAAILCLALLYLALLGISEIAFRNALDKLRAEGRPTTLSEIVPPEGKFPDFQNAALLYGAAGSILNGVAVDMPSEKADASTSLSLSSAVGDAKWASKPSYGVKVKELLQKSYGKQLDIVYSVVEEGTKKPSCRFPIKYENGFMTTLDHLNGQRGLSRMIALRIEMELEEKRFDAAWASLLVGLKHANALESEPLLISQLVRMAQLGILCDSMKSILAKPEAAPSPAIAEETLKLLKPFENPLPISRSIDCGERVMAQDAVLKLHQTNLLFAMSGKTDALERAIVFVLRRAPTTKLDLAEQMKISVEIGDSFKKPFSIDEVPAMKRKIKALPFYCPISNMLLSALSPMKLRYGIALANAREAALALKLVQFKNANGGYPKALSEIASGDELTDPFANKAFVYKTDGSGFLLYSIGKNFKDDGSDASKRNDDIVWRLPATWGAEIKPLPKP